MPFNPKTAINPIAFYSAFTPASTGTIVLAIPPEPGDGYNVTPSAPTLYLSTVCAGVRVSDKNPAYDRSDAGSVDKVIYRAMLQDTEATRGIRSGMYARIFRKDGLVVEGVVDLVEYRNVGGVRLYIDAGQNVSIDWSEFVSSQS